MEHKKVSSKIRLFADSLGLVFVLGALSNAGYIASQYAQSCTQASRYDVPDKYIAKWGDYASKQVDRFSDVRNLIPFSAIFIKNENKPKILPKSESEVSQFDANNDGIQDVVIFDAKEREHFAFIGREDGTFERAKVITQDGVPFYQTENGHYDSWGKFFPKK